MNKMKLSSGLGSILLVASLFAGWQTLLLITILMFVFCEIEESVKDVAIKVITFFVGFTIVSIGWDIVINGVSAVTGGIDSLVGMINTYLDSIDYINANKLIAPIHAVKNIASSIMTVLFMVVKLGFIISILTGKSGNKNILSSKIDEYVNKALNYVSGNVTNMNSTMQTAPSAPSSSMPQANTMNVNNTTMNNNNNSMNGNQ